MVTADLKRDVRDTYLSECLRLRPYYWLYASASLQIDALGAEEKSPCLVLDQYRLNSI
jgi:hypothetical protein